MRTRTKINLVLMTMGINTALAVIGSTAATLAWYANSTMAKVSYMGTSISNSGRFILGLVDNSGLFTDEDLETYNCERESGATVDGNTIIWSKSSLVFSDFLAAYLTKYHYSVNLLSPVTSKSTVVQDLENDIVLYKAPETGQIHADEVAEQRSYLRFKFAFKVVNTDGSKAADEKIWLTGSAIETDHANAEQSIRLFVNNDHEQFIVKPTDNGISAGTTTVGGFLNLDGSDDVYDYDRTTGKEFVYGEYDTTGGFEPTYASVDKYEDDALFDENELYNENNLEAIFTTGPSTFYAKHKKDCHPITNLNELKSRFKTVGHETAVTIAPTISQSGYTGGKPIAYTDSASSIGYSNITIYAEGWDHSLTDEIIGVQFNLGLTFETNRI